MPLRSETTTSQGPSGRELAEGRGCWWLLLMRQAWSAGNRSWPASKWMPFTASALTASARASRPGCASRRCHSAAVSCGVIWAATAVAAPPQNGPGAQSPPRRWRTTSAHRRRSRLLRRRAARSGSSESSGATAAGGRARSVAATRAATAPAAAGAAAGSHQAGASPSRNVEGRLEGRSKVGSAVNNSFCDPPHAPSRRQLDK